MEHKNVIVPLSDEDGQSSANNEGVQMTITEQIAEYICDELSRPLSNATIHHSKRAVIDWFAAMYSGSLQEPNPMLRESLINTDDAQHAIIFPEGKFSTVRTAAF